MARKDNHNKPKTDAPRRRSKRKSTRATPPSKNFEEMVKEAESLARESIYEEACARKNKHTGSPFRLLDLPPELRMKIFGFMVFRPDSLPLQDLVAPLITAVSKQVRAECMASFFALNRFQMVVETNICLVQHMNWISDRFGSLRAARQRPSLPANTRYWLHLIYRVEPRAGGIHMKGNTENWLRKIHRDVAVFRSIEIVLNDVLDHPALCASNPRAPQEIQLAWIIEGRGWMGRNIVTVSMFHSKQLVPHFVSWPVDSTTTLDYYDLPGKKLMRLLEANHPHLDTFDFDALKTWANTVGHWGVY
jgi:hypothetical protein